MKKLLLIPVGLFSATVITIAAATQKTNLGRTATAAPAQTAAASNQAAAPQGMMRYRDGTYVGSAADAVYGTIQVRATISGGRLADVSFLQYPNDARRSQEINAYAMPQLRSEALSAQSANVDIVSGASDSSAAFQQSLSDALGKAQA